MTSSQYSAVVLYYRAGEVVWRTIDQLSKQSHPPKQIILVDNASGDGVCAARDDINNLTVIVSSENLGYSRGMWLGVQQVDFDVEWIMLVTHEVELERECAAELVHTGRVYGAAQVGPLVMTSGSNRVWSAGGTFNRLGNARHDEESLFSAKSVKWLEGCCFLVRRDLATDDLFDGDYFIYWDDVDISTKLAKHGPVICTPSARCWQITLGQPAYYGSRNRVIYWRKHGRHALAALAGLESLLRAVRDVTRSDLTAAKGRLRGVTDGYRQRPRRIRMVRS